MRVSDHQWDSGALDNSPPDCRSAPTTTAMWVVVVGRSALRRYSDAEPGGKASSGRDDHTAARVPFPTYPRKSPHAHRRAGGVLPFDQSDALEFDPALVALAARGPDSRIRLPCGEAEPWLMTSHARVRQVTRDPRLSRAAIVGRCHPRMAPEPIVAPEAVNVADTPVGTAARSDDLRTARRTGGGPRGPARVHDAAAATAPGSGICVWPSVRKRCAGTPRPSAAPPSAFRRTGDAARTHPRRECSRTVRRSRPTASPSSEPSGPPSSPRTGWPAWVRSSRTSAPTAWTRMPRSPAPEQRTLWLTLEEIEILPNARHCCASWSARPASTDGARDVRPASLAEAETLLDTRSRLRTTDTL